MKKYVLLFALAFGGLFVAGCEAPTVSARCGLLFQDRGMQLSIQ